MSMKEKLMQDLKQAMKDKDIIKKNVVQMIRASILQVEKDKQIELGDEEIINIISKEGKKRKDALEDYKKSGREDLVNQIEEEINIINTYLPKQLTKEELTTEIEKIIEELQATSIKDMGKVMKLAKERIGAKSDGKSINEVVKTLLN